MRIVNAAAALSAVLFFSTQSGYAAKEFRVGNESIENPTAGFDQVHENFKVGRDMKTITVGNFPDSNAFKYVLLTVVFDTSLIFPPLEPGFQPVGALFISEAWPTPGAPADFYSIVYQGACVVDDEAHDRSTDYLQLTIFLQPDSETFSFAKYSEEFLDSISEVTVDTICETIIPESTTWTMLVLGFGLMGAAAMRPGRASSRAA